MFKASLNFNDDDYGRRAELAATCEKRVTNTPYTQRNAKCGGSR